MYTYISMCMINSMMLHSNQAGALLPFTLITHTHTHTLLSARFVNDQLCNYLSATAVATAANKSQSQADIWHHHYYHRYILELSPLLHTRAHSTFRLLLLLLLFVVRTRSKRLLRGPPWCFCVPYLVFTFDRLRPIILRTRIHLNAHTYTPLHTCTLHNFQVRVSVCVSMRSTISKSF